MDSDQLIKRAQEAAMIKEHPLLKDALKDMESMILAQIVACPLDKPEIERRLVDSLRVMKQFEASLQSHIDTGKIESLNLQAKESWLARMKRTA